MLVNEPDPIVVHTTEVRESSAAWWVGGMVAIAAIIAIVFFVTRESPVSPTALTNATEQGRVAGQIEASQSNAATADANAQISAQSAADRANIAADRAAAATDAATRAAQPAPPTVQVTIPSAPAAPAQ